MLTPGRLLEWDRLERSRRRAAQAIDARLVIAGLGVALGGGLFGVERLYGAAEARGWWVVLAAGLVAWIVMGGPWRVYWRQETPLLARLPVSGRALWRLCVARSDAAGVTAGAIAAIAALPMVVSSTPAELARAGAVLAVGAVTATLAAPAVTAAAGAMVASDQARRAVASVSGEMAGGPAVIWLSVLPSLGGFASGALVWLLAPWIARGGDLARAGLIGGIGLGAAIAVHLAGLALAERWLGAALREVSALDAVKLAHVELDRARGLEALWGNVAAGAGRAVYHKDVALSRRRFPAYYIVSGVLLLAAWIAAVFADEPMRTRVAVFSATGLAIYTIVMGRRLAAPPIERPLLLATLPIPPSAASRAKRAYVVWRSLVPIVLATAPAIARSHAPLDAAIIPAAILAASILLGSVAARPARSG